MVVWVFFLSQSSGALVDPTLPVPPRKAARKFIEMGSVSFIYRSH